MKPRVNTSSASGQPPLERLVLVDRHVVLVARIDLQEPDAAALEAEFDDAVRHHLGILAAAAAAHVGERRRGLAPHRLRMGAAHGIDERRLAFAAAPRRSSTAHAIPNGR